MIYLFLLCYVLCVCGLLGLCVCVDDEDSWVPRFVVAFVLFGISQVFLLAMIREAVRTVKQVVV